MAPPFLCRYARRMSDENQERRPDAAGRPAEDEHPGLGQRPDPAPAEPPVLSQALRGPGEEAAGSAAPPPWHKVLRELSPPGFLLWLAMLFWLGLAALLLGQTDTALLIGVAGLFVTAQGADTHRDWFLVNALVSWVPSAVGVVFLVALAGILVRSPFPPATRYAVTAIAGAGALLCFLSIFRPVADFLCRLFFRDGRPGHTLRLGARLVLFALVLAPSAWFSLRGTLSSVLDEPSLLVTSRGLSGSLVGYVILALGSVGWLIRRPWRGTLDRLGLKPLQRADWLVIPLGVAALWAFNTGSEWAQRTMFPSLWAGDQHFTQMLARLMGPGQMLLLGLSAGVGEEITLRGALQPRLGIVLTSLVFASLHVQYSWYGIASIFVFGLILGTIRQRSSTTAAIVVHGLYDVLALASAKS